MIRGCGTRQAGGIYLEVATSPFGMPLEHFLLDPPRLIQPMSIGLSPIGVRGITDGHGVYHVVDWVGTEHYPKLADFLDEAQVGGISRRCEGSGVDYSKITPESRLLLAHSRASFANALTFMGMIATEANAWACTKAGCRCGNCQEIARIHANTFAECRKAIEEHDGDLAKADVEYFDATHADCLALHSHDFGRDDLTADGATEIGTGARSYWRKRPHGQYLAKRRPSYNGNEFRPEYRIAIFARLPIGSIAVVRDRNKPERETSQFEKASAAHVDVRLVDE